MKGSVKSTPAAAPYIPPKMFKKIGSALHHLIGGKANEVGSYTIVDENADGYFVVYFQAQGAKHTYMTTVQFIGREKVEG